MALLLGSVLFADLELPERIGWAGAHLVATHKLIGGTRVLDAMGADPRPLEWAGRFQGGDAVGRALQVDAMRQSGARVICAFGGLAYEVIVWLFEPDYERPYQVPYRIQCGVVRDASFGIFFPAASLQRQIANDIAAVTRLVPAN